MAKGVYIGVEKKPTLMLLHGDDLTESANNLPVTNNSVTVVDDAGAFGGKALNFSGLGQYLSIADDTLSLPDDFTIDFRLYNAGSTSWRGIFETAGATSSNWTFHKGGLNISLGDGSNLLFAGIAKGGGTYSTLNTPANSVPVGTWSHIALVRSNGVMTFYINGVSSASLSDSEAVTTDGTILIGKHDIRDDMYLNGKIDEFRVSSVARWTSNFTPPTEAYPNDEAGVGIARKVKKMYYGVGNLARKIKRGYIGVGGVARVFYTSEIFDYYGPVTSASEFRYCIDTMSTPTHAIFPGNYYGNLDACYTVDAYDANLIHSTPASLSYGHRGCGTGNVGQYGIIAGGYRTDIISSLNSGVEAYDANLTKVIATAMRSRRTCDGASTPNRVLFAAGRDEDRRNLNEVDVYDANLTRSAATGTTFYGNTNSYSNVSFNGYAVFFSSVSQNIVNMYNDSLVRTQTTFDNEQNDFSIASNKNYLFLAGGYYDIPDRAMTSRVQVYDKNFVKLNNTNLKDAKMYSGSGFSSSKAAVILPARTFLGMFEYELVPNYDVFDENLVRTNPEFSSLIIGESACASVGGYCVSGLGYVDNGTTVDSSTDMVAFTFDG